MRYLLAALLLLVSTSVRADLILFTFSAGNGNAATGTVDTTLNIFTLNTLHAASGSTLQVVRRCYPLGRWCSMPTTVHLAQR